MLWLPYGRHGHTAWYTWLLFKYSRLHRQVHLHRENRTVDSGTGWLGELQLMYITEIV